MKSSIVFFLPNLFFLVSFDVPLIKKDRHCNQQEPFANPTQRAYPKTEIKKEFNQRRVDGGRCFTLFLRREYSSAKEEKRYI